MNGATAAVIPLSIAVIVLAAACVYWRHTAEKAMKIVESLRYPLNHLQKDYSYRVVVVPKKSTICPQCNDVHG